MIKKAFLLFYILFIFGFIQKTAAQSSINVPLNKYGIPVVSSEDTYLAQIAEDSSQEMILLPMHLPGFIMDLRYATRNNFMDERMYPSSVHYTFLRLPAARALEKVRETLLSKGLGLKIFDAYRPYATTEKFWEKIHDERYVANPAKASGHNKGISIDLTLIDLKTNRALDMGTGFDNFTDTAHADFTALPAHVLQNRRLLKEVMESNGFKQLETEWWHFTFQSMISYDALNLSFKTLKKLALKNPIPQ